MEHENRLFAAWTRFLQNRVDAVAGLTRGLPHPRRLIDMATQRLDDWSERLASALPTLLAQKSQQLAVASAKLQTRNLAESLTRHAQDLNAFAERMGRMILRSIHDREQTFMNLIQLLESLNPMRVLERGFALVKDKQGRIISRAAQMQPASHQIVFYDGSKTVMPLKD
jgi:exodeoxyribonuclease VII large subunit